jgi:hypothetical protein
MMFIALTILLCLMPCFAHVTRCGQHYLYVDERVMYARNSRSLHGSFCLRFYINIMMYVDVGGASGCIRMRETEQLV